MSYVSVSYCQQLFSILFPVMLLEVYIIQNDMFSMEGFNISPPKLFS